MDSRRTRRGRGRGEARNVGQQAWAGSPFMPGQFDPAWPQGTCPLSELSIYGQVSGREMSLEHVILGRNKHSFKQPVL